MYLFRSINIDDFVDALNKMIQWVEVLRTKDEIEQIKTKVLFEIIDGFQV